MMMILVELRLCDMRGMCLEGRYPCRMIDAEVMLSSRVDLFISRVKAL